MISKMCLPHEAEDLKQDVFLALMEKPPSLIRDLNERGMLFFYTTSVIKNLLVRTIKKNVSARKIFTEIGDCDMVDDETDIDYTPYINSLPTINDFPYFAELVKSVSKHGSQLSAAKAMGIPVSSVRRDILFVRDYLKSKVC